MGEYAAGTYLRHTVILRDLLCDVLAEAHEDRRDLCAGRRARRGQRGRAGARDQAGGIGPSHGVGRIGADLRALEVQD